MRLWEKVSRGRPRETTRVYISKENGKERPIQKATAEVLNVLNTIYEQVFLECSYGSTWTRAVPGAGRSGAIRRHKTHLRI